MQTAFKTPMSLQDEPAPAFTQHPVSDLQRSNNLSVAEPDSPDSNSSSSSGSSARSADLTEAGSGDAGETGRDASIAASAGPTQAEAQSPSDAATASTQPANSDLAAADPDFDMSEWEVIPSQVPPTLQPAANTQAPPQASEAGPAPGSRPLIKSGTGPGMRPLDSPRSARGLGTATLPEQNPRSNAPMPPVPGSKLFLVRHRGRLQLACGVLCVTRCSHRAKVM